MFFSMHSFNFITLRLDCHLKDRFLFLFHIKGWLGDFKLLWKIQSSAVKIPFPLISPLLQCNRRFYSGNISA